MLSMTGYGKGEFLGEGINLVVEIKTVNNRIFDFNARMPRNFISLEDMVRKTVQSYISRGRVDLFVTFSDTREKSAEININFAKAKAYYDASKRLSKEYGIKNDVTSTFLLKSPEVIDDKNPFDVEEIKSALKSAVEDACKNLNSMREEEGKRLFLDMFSRLEVIQNLRNTIVERAPLVAKEYKEKLSTRIQDALANVNFDESRLLNEVAFFTDKANIDEELTRLLSHVQSFKDIAKEQAPGKKLDFLMQEFNREANTICSKASDIEITQSALLIKNEIEKIREQVQNIE